MENRPQTKPRDAEVSLGQGILQAKLAPPQAARRPIERASVLHRLGTPGPLTIVRAPPGYGKTSTVVAWLGRLPGRLAWVSLDRRDNQPARFLRVLAAAIQTVEPDSGRALVAVGDRLRDADVPHMVEGLLNDLQNGSDNVTLVLDDFHHITDPAALAAVETFMEWLPPRVSVVLASRREPHLPLARWRLGGRLAEIGPEDLRLTAEEARDFLAETMQLDLSDEDVLRLHLRTEGWIGGLQMAALSIQGAGEPGRIIDSFDGRNRFVMDYLLDEVLAAQPAAIRQFLLQTSVLDRMSAGLCQAVTGMADSAGILDTLEQSQLFLVPLDERREWFRYHALFADLLRHQLSRSADLRTADYQLAASRWFEVNGLLDEAADLALAAGDNERVATIFELHGFDMMMAGKSRQVHALMSRLPAERIAGNPDRLSVALFARYNREGMLPLEMLRQLEAAIAHDTDDARRRRTTDVVRLIEAIEGVRTKRDYQKALELVSSGTEGVTPLSSTMLPAIVAGAAHKLGRSAKASEYYDIAVRRAVAEKATHLFGILLGQARLEQARHGPRAARAAFDRARDLVERLGWGDLPFMSWLLTGEAATAAEMADPVAGTLYREAIHLARSEPSVVRHVARVGLADLLLRAGRAEEAEAELAELAHVPYFPPFMSVLPDFDVAWARHDLARSDTRRATDLMARRGIPTDRLSPETTQEEGLLLGRLLLQENRPGAATAVLTALLERVATDGWLEPAVLVRIDLSAAALLRGDTAAGMALLSQALSEGVEAGFIASFLHAPPQVASMLAALATSGSTSEAAAAARSVLARTTADSEVGADDSLTAKERRVLQLLCLGLTNRELADRLFVSENTIKTHLKNVYGKLGIRNRAEAVMRAQELGLGQTDTGG